MTPAEMREAAAVLVERCEWYATASLGRLAAAIRALPLAEEAPPPREKLRRVREARELLATARVAARERTPEEQAYDVVAEAVADRDRLRALLAAYGRAVEERREDVAADALLDIEDEAAKWREWG